MKRTALIVLAVSAAIPAAGCGPVNRSVNSVKAPEIRAQQLGYDLTFDRGNALSAGRADGLADYFRAIGAGYGDRIAVDDPELDGAEARRAAVAAVAARFGLLLDEARPITRGALAPGTVRVVVTRSRAVVEDCPDWRRKSNPETSASAMSNYGCAVVGNLAAMVADPQELVAGGGYAGTDGHTVTKAVDAFRRREPSGAKEGAGLMSPTSGAAVEK